MPIDKIKTDTGYSWRVKIRKKGFPFISRTFQTKEEAEKFEKMTLEGMEFSDLDPGKTIPSLPLSVWIDRYKKEVIPTKKYGKSEINYLNFWLEHLGNKIAINITSTEIEILADNLYSKMTRHGTATSSETRRKYIIFLSVVYSTAIRDWKWAIHNPITFIKWEKEKAAYRQPKKSMPIPEAVTKKVESFKKMAFSRMDIMNISIAKLSKKIGIPETTVQGCFKENGNPSFINMLKIADFLGFELKILPLAKHEQI